MEKLRTRGEVEEQGEVVSIEHTQGGIRNSPARSMLALAPHHSLYLHHGKRPQAPGLEDLAQSARSQ